MGRAARLDVSTDGTDEKSVFDREAGADLSLPYSQPQARQQNRLNKRMGQSRRHLLQKVSLYDMYHRFGAPIETPEGNQWGRGIGTHWF